MTTGRVTHVVRSDAFAGTERYICTAANGLAERGWEVTVIGGAGAVMRAELIPTVRHVGAADQTLAVARALASLGPTDIIHAHMTAAELAAVLARPFHRTPIVATRHFAARRGSSLAGRLAGRLNETSIVADISISQFVADHIGRPSTILYNPIPPVPHSPATAKTVLMAQRLEREKDTATGLRAWAESRLATYGWLLQLAGEGSERGALERLASDLGIDGSVEFLGRVNDMDDRRQNTGVFLATAPAEPFGLSVAEAMAAGLPVIAADGGAHRETVGENPALLFPPGDSLAAAERLRSFANSPLTSRIAIGGTLRERAVTLFAVDRHVIALEAIYRKFA